MCQALEIEGRQHGTPALRRGMRGSYAGEEIRASREQYKEGGKNPAVPREWQGLVGAGSERSLMPLQAGVGWG